ncbi:type III-B CRISPR module RAMP protein Cmr1 [Thermocrinis sp.]
MQKLTFELEFITPAFIGGADGKSAELRPASFVGLLRWWWRALKGECNIGDLREQEVEIFGGDGKQRSKVFVKVWGDVRLKDQSFKDVYKLSREYDKVKRTLRRDHAGIGYLLFSTMLKGRGFIDAGSRSFVSFTGEAKYLNHYIASLWALVFLGGVGLRSRRGGGNLAVVNAPENLPISFLPSGDVVQWYRENLIKAKELVLASKGLCEDYSNLSDAKIKVSDQQYKTWVEALNSIGNIFLDYRANVKRDIFRSAVFGLPIKHGKEFIRTTSRNINRRSSPLIIKVIKTSEGHYRWVLVRLSGRFLPEDVEVPDDIFDLLNEFLNKTGGKLV